jgi:multiple sugar transport system substrate-binding protein
MPIITEPTEIFQAPQTGAPPPGSPPQQPFPQAPPNAPTPPGALPPPVTPPPPPGVPVPPVPSAPGGKKKLLFIIGGIVLVILLLIGIGFVVSASSGKDEEKAELTYWGVYQSPQVMQGLIDEFERDNPNITITFVQQDAKQYRDRLMTRIQNGNGPDIFRYHNAWVPMMTGVLLPLSQDSVSPADFEKAYYPVVKADLVRNGGILGIPLSIDTLAMYTNDQMFSAQRLKPPTNWNEFALAAAALTTRVEDGEEKGKITTAGTALGTYDNVTHASDIISLMLVQSGVNLFDITAAKKKEEDLECETFACGALSYYTIFAKGDTNVQKVWDGTLDPSVIAFANGRVGMFFGYSWDMLTIRGINPSLSYSVHPVPNLSGQKKTIASYWVEGVSSKSQYPEAAMKFMQYLHKKETQVKYYTENAKLNAVGAPYSRVDLAPTLKQERLLYPFVQQAPYAVSTPFVADTQDTGLNATLNGYLKNAVLQISGNTSPESAVTTLDQGVKQAMVPYAQQ